MQIKCSSLALEAAIFGFKSNIFILPEGKERLQIGFYRVLITTYDDNIGEKLKKTELKNKKSRKNIVSRFEAMEEFARILINKSKDIKLFETLGISAMSQEE